MRKLICWGVSIAFLVTSLPVVSVYANELNLPKPGFGLHLTRESVIDYYAVPNDRTIQDVYRNLKNLEGKKMGESLGINAKDALRQILVRQNKLKTEMIDVLINEISKGNDLWAPVDADTDQLIEQFLKSLFFESNQGRFNERLEFVKRVFDSNPGLVNQKHNWIINQMYAHEDSYEKELKRPCPHFSEIGHAMGLTLRLGGDKAMKGGIDLTPANMNLETQNAGEGIEFHINPLMLKQLENTTGFVPVIISMKPMLNIRAFLGLTQ